MFIERNHYKELHKFILYTHTKTRFHFSLTSHLPFNCHLGNFVFVCICYSLFLSDKLFTLQILQSIWTLMRSIVLWTVDCIELYFKNLHLHSTHFVVGVVSINTLTSCIKVQNDAFFFSLNIYFIKMYDFCYGQTVTLKMIIKKSYLCFNLRFARQMCAFI